MWKASFSIWSWKWPRSSWACLWSDIIMTPEHISNSNSTFSYLAFSCTQFWPLLWDSKYVIPSYTNSFFCPTLWDCEVKISSGSHSQIWLFSWMSFFYVYRWLCSPQARGFWISLFEMGFFLESGVDSWVTSPGLYLCMSMSISPDHPSKLFL